MSALMFMDGKLGLKDTYYFRYYKYSAIDSIGNNYAIKWHNELHRKE